MGRHEAFKALAWNSGCHAVPVAGALVGARPAHAHITGQSDDWYVALDLTLERVRPYKEFWLVRAAYFAANRSYHPYAWFAAYRH
jgi:hypothetical protein